MGSYSLNFVLEKRINLNRRKKRNWRKRKLSIDCMCSRLSLSFWLCVGPYYSALDLKWLLPSSCNITRPSHHPTASWLIPISSTLVFRTSWSWSVAWWIVYMQSVSVLLRSRRLLFVQTIFTGIPCVTDCVLAELEKLGHRYRVALRCAAYCIVCSELTLS